MIKKEDLSIQQKLLTINKQTRPGKKRDKTTKIVIHYVGNTNSTAINNRNYFESLKGNTKGKFASSHYIIGLEGEIIQAVPDDELAYTSNSANSYSVAIENCHSENGVFNQKTRESLIKLTAVLLKQYNLKVTDILRHFDITGKSCPLAWASNTGPKFDDFNKFKQEVKDFMEKEEEKNNVDIINIEINGKVCKCNVINKDGNNFIKLQDLRQGGITIDYNKNLKIPIIKTK